MKRGRGKNAKKGKTKNLNAGQIIGEGRQRIHLPGLNTNVKTADRIQKQSHDTPDPDWYDCAKFDRCKLATILKRMFIWESFIGIRNFSNFVTPPEHAEK